MASNPGTEQFRKLLREQATPRAVAGLVALVALLAVTGLSSLSGQVARQSNRLSDLERELAIQQSLSENTDWIDRATSAQQTVSAVETRFWRGATAGIVAAQLQSTLERLAANAGLSTVRVAIQPTPTELAHGAVVFEISIVSRDRNGQFLSFMQALSRENSTLIPTSFEWRRANGNAIFTLQAPAIIEPETEGQI